MRCGRRPAASGSARWVGGRQMRAAHRSMMGAVSTSAASDTDGPGEAAPRATYHHGDLRRALLDAGIDLAREGGPDKVVLREATRRAGVVPNAAYRHFASRQDLLQAVRAWALSSLAIAMEAEIGGLR